MQIFAAVNRNRKIGRMITSITIAGSFKICAKNRHREYNETEPSEMKLFV